MKRGVDGLTEDDDINDQDDEADDTAASAVLPGVLGLDADDAVGGGEGHAGEEEGVDESGEHGE